ncbi:hypothetical protein BCY89_27625 [Sphingobacterium siyangense]|uniref:RNA polymerase sigma-70 factor (ECF subfamily) n=1 Tax=Sphingobacterium siyangense TaxID=459529 RepID=A0A420FXJ8_9SPHI|nr:hypothetical protein [Sphingobacterium siyangense]RKF37651.1 hypothetical protein BCY89_27625 [Sphingobacterium siyangense]
MNFIERKILETIIKGDQSAFKAIYDQLSGGWVNSVALTIIKNDDIAQVVVQDVLDKLCLNKSK